MEALAERTEYYDLTLKQEELFDLGLWEQNSHEEYAFSVAYSGGTVYLPLGTQFYQGEPVQIWAEYSSKGSDVYLYRKDGGKELLLKNVPGNYTSADSKCQWYIDRDGNFYCRSVSFPQVKGKYKMQGSCVKILSSGEILPTNKMEVGITAEDICQTEDGRTYLLLEDQEEHKKHENGVAIYPAYYGTDVSEEKQARFIAEIEDAKCPPMRTRPILEIILAEAADYFYGMKNAEEVSKVVNNRVQLYLDEQK